MSYLPDFTYLPVQVRLVLCAMTAALVIWGGLQDWRNREVTDWITWPLFIMGGFASLLSAWHLDFFPLIVAIVVLTAWYFDWMGGADARVMVGLWGLWPLAGFLGMAAVGLWGLALVLRKRGQERIPALVAVALVTGLTFLAEVAKMIV